MKNFLKLLTALALTALPTVHSTRAGSHTWSGANSIYFNNVSNWSYGGAPTNGEQDVHLYFPAGVTRYTPSNNIPGLSVAMISFAGDNYTLSGNSITLTGGTNLMSSGDVNIVALPLVLAGSNTAVSVASGKLFTLTPRISGASHLTKIGAGKLLLNGPNTNLFTGTTFVNEGILQISGYGPDSTVPGPLIIGTPAGSPGTAIAQLLGSSKLRDANVVTINNTGVLDLNNNNEAVGGLVMAGGKLETGTGTLTLFGAVMVQAGTAAINGNLRFYYSNGVFNALPGGTLNVNGSISSYINDPGIVKTGAGAVNLYSANTFTGPAIVKQGYLGLGHAQALANSSGLTITNIGIVQMLGVGITNIPATISGNGNGNGALRAFGTNVWTGPITLAGNAGIQPFASTDLLFHLGGITGIGNLTKLGSGKLSMAGASWNNYQGTTIVSGGTLELNTSGGVAIPGALIIGDATNGVNSRSVRLMQSNQIADGADVTVNASGMIDFTGIMAAAERIGSLAGAGNVHLGFNALFTGTNNATTTFSGEFSGAAASSVTKEGAGITSVDGISPAFFGQTFVNRGTLSVNGSLASSAVYAALNGTVAGDGVTGVLAAFDGKITPGNSPGLLKCANFGMSSASVLELELNGTSVGINYDQIGVTGFVNLGNANLSVLLGFNSAVSNKFLIIANDSNDPINGTFKNLPEGAIFSTGNAQFQISYLGGDGNDVELTQIGVIAPPLISGLQDVGNGQMQISGKGSIGMSYHVEANTNLNTTNWITLGSVVADGNGGLKFIDSSASNVVQRFYRFKAQ